MKVNIKEVAKISGVAVSTVSMALNDSSEISENTKLRIKSVAKQLGYVPNSIARKLVSGKSKTIGLIAPQIKGISYFPELCLGIEQIASERGYRVITCNFDGKDKKLFDHLRFFVELQVDGIISIPQLNEDTIDTLTLIRDKGIKIVSANQATDRFGLDTVLYDAKKAARLAVEHLVKCGNKNIALLVGSASTGYDQEKEAAYKEVISEHNLPYTPSLTEYNETSVEGGFVSMSKLIASGQKIDAVFAATDIMAIGAMKAIINAGLKIPDDIAVMGFDNMNAVIPFAPVPLSTVDIAKHEMGVRLCNILIDRIENSCSDNSPQKIYLEPELVVRKSTIR
jgi:DNA-binding LacI/PurR family transcriptional regulator